MKTLWFTVIALVLGGCAARVPPAISNAPKTTTTVLEIQQADESVLGTQVRWGGEITNIENKASHTRIEVVARELKKNGKPDTASNSHGRFIASFPGFVDPLVFEKGRLLTVIGTIEGKTKQPIGEFDYTFPVVNVESSYLWEREADYIIYDRTPAWYYDPWYYDPWYRRRPYPPYYW